MERGKAGFQQEWLLKRFFGHDRKEMYRPIPEWMDRLVKQKEKDKATGTTAAKEVDPQSANGKPSALAGQVSKPAAPSHGLRSSATFISSRTTASSSSTTQGVASISAPAPTSITSKLPLHPARAAAPSSAHASASAPSSPIKEKAGSKTSPSQSHGSDDRIKVGTPPQVKAGPGCEFWYPEQHGWSRGTFEIKGGSLF